MQDHQFDPDRVYVVTAWRAAPWWILDIEGVAVTDVFRLAEAEYMARDLLAGLLNVDARDVRVCVVRGIGPVQDPGSRSPRSWFWAGVGALWDWRARRRWERRTD